MNDETIVLTADGTLDRRTIPVPEPQADQVLLRVELTGVCDSDVHMWQHDLGFEYPVVPGHEFVGSNDDAMTSPA